MVKICKNCIYWKKDWGIYCFNGWTGSGSGNGYCHYEPKKIYKKEKEIACSKYK